MSKLNTKLDKTDQSALKSLLSQRLKLQYQGRHRVIQEFLLVLHRDYFRSMNMDIKVRPTKITLKIGSWIVKYTRKKNGSWWTRQISKSWMRD